MPKLRSILPAAAFTLVAAVHRDPAGFSVDAPSGWTVKSFAGGHVSITEQGNEEFVMVSPVLGRGNDCRRLLEGSLSGSWATFPGVTELSIQTPARGMAVARFGYRGGAARGAVMCAATGRRSAMFYAMGAPAGRFATDRAKMVGVLRSFRYGAQGESAATGGGVAANAAPAIPMEPWLEQSEGAFQAVKPAGWRAEGGVLRNSNSDVRVGYRLARPDGQAVMFMGDTRLNNCMVPGPQYSGMGALGGGYDLCPYREGAQIAEEYLTRAVAPEWRIEGLRITERRRRPDLTETADRVSNSAGGNARNAYGEVTFEGHRGGSAIRGTMVGNTQFHPSVTPQMIAGSYMKYVTGYLAPAGQASATLSALGKIHASFRWNTQWIAGNRAASARDHEAIRQYQQWQAELGRKMFEERSESAQRRSNAVGDLLRGRVRLRDAEGNQYEAQAGSNYYYAEETGARTGDPNTTIIGSDVWISPNNGVIDLRPLEVIQ
jgi:hypothetical protein